MIKNLLIDLDDTIFDFHLAEKIALSKTLNDFGIEPSLDVVTAYSEINASLWRQLEAGTMTREAVLVGRFEILFSKLQILADAKEARRSYEKNLSRGHYFTDGAEELLKKLYGSKRLYLASNGTASVQRPRIDSSGIEKYFDGIFISEEVGFNKPDERFFEAIFNTIPEFKKEETLILGDSLTSDIKGGIDSGILTCYFNARGKSADGGITPHFTVDSLYEIPKLLKSL